MAREAQIRLLCLSLLGAARVAVPLLGLNRVRAIQSNLVAHAAAWRRKPTVSLESLLLRIERCSASVPGANCLTRALAGQLIAALHGYAVVLRIGVKAAPQVEGHAWLELDGAPCISSDSPAEYSPMELSVKP